MAKPPTDPSTDSVAASAVGRDGAKPLPPSTGAVELSEFEREVIAVFVDMMQTLGLPKSYGEIYGLLYATPQPLGFGEIHERLGLSKGSISGGLKALRELGAVRVAASAQERREVYEAEIEMRKLLSAIIAERLEPQLKASIARMAQLGLVLEQAELPVAERAVLANRIGKLANWRKKAAGLLPWVRRFLG